MNNDKIFLMLQRKGRKVLSTSSSRSADESEECVYNPETMATKLQWQ